MRRVLSLWFVTLFLVSCSVIGWRAPRAVSIDPAFSLIRDIPFRHLDGRIAVSADGSCFAAYTREGPICIYNAETGREAARIKTPRTIISCVDLDAQEEDKRIIVAATVTRILDTFHGPNSRCELEINTIEDGKSRDKAIIPAVADPLKICGETLLAIPTGSTCDIYDWKKAERIKQLDVRKLDIPYDNLSSILNFALSANRNILAFSQFDNFGIWDLRKSDFHNLLDRRDYPPMLTKVCDITEDGALAMFAGPDDIAIFRRKGDAYALLKIARASDTIAGVCFAGNRPLFATFGGRILTMVKESRMQTVLEIPGGDVWSMRRCGEVLLIGRSDDVLMVHVDAQWMHDPERAL